MTKRWVATDFGGLDVLEFVDVEVPDPGPGEVTITVAMTLLGVGHP